MWEERALPLGDFSSERFRYESLKLICDGQIEYMLSVLLRHSRISWLVISTVTLQDPSGELSVSTAFSLQLASVVTLLRVSCSGRPSNAVHVRTAFHSSH